MNNYYTTINGIVTTFSNIETDANGFDNVKVYFERLNEKGFDFAAICLPENRLIKSYGFSEDELLGLHRYAVNNAPLIWEFAKEGAANAQGLA